MPFFFQCPSRKCHAPKNNYSSIFQFKPCNKLCIQNQAQQEYTAKNNNSKKTEVETITTS